MKPSDRIVVTLIKADGTKHKVFDKVVGGALLYLFKFDLSSWGQSSLSPHMAGQRGLTPPGYG
jgi:hypothetical protein